jgi:2-dehydropantoate 2-reductase
MTIEKLNLLVLGAGAVGTYIGGSLALKKHQVTFVERPEPAKRLSIQGLTLALPAEEVHLDNVNVTTDLGAALTVNKYDLILFALKSYDTNNVLRVLSQYDTNTPPLLCMQNGVENEIRIEETLGKEKVIAGTLTTAIGRRGIGNIIVERFRGMGISAEHDFSHNLIDIFNNAELNARLYAHAADMKWSKLLTNLISNASSAILDMTPYEIYEDPELCDMEIHQLREALNVMSALDIQVVDLPGTPVRALTFAVRNLPSALSRTLLKNAIGAGRGGKMPSFHIDLRDNHGMSEVDYLNGAVVRFGEQTHIPTPVNNFLVKTLTALTEGDIPLDQYTKQPKKFIDDYKAFTDHKQ